MRRPTAVERQLIQIAGAEKGVCKRPPCPPSTMCSSIGVPRRRGWEEGRTHQLEGKEVPSRKDLLHQTLKRGENLARIPLLGSDTPHTSWLAGRGGCAQASHLTSSSAGTHTNAPRSAPPKPRQTTTRGSGGRRGCTAGAVQVRAGAVGLRGSPTLTLAAAGSLSRSDPAPGRRSGMWRLRWLGLGSARAPLRALGATGRPGSCRQGEKRPRARGRQAGPGRSRCGVR